MPVPESRPPLLATRRATARRVAHAPAEHRGVWAVLVFGSVAAGDVDVLVVGRSRSLPLGARPDQAEVREARFFRLDALPVDTSPATRRRLAEYLNGQPPAEEW